MQGGWELPAYLGIGLGYGWASWAAGNGADVGQGFQGTTLGQMTQGHPVSQLPSHKEGYGFPLLMSYVLDTVGPQDTPVK